MSIRDKYLFIRILEACNADCFMCDYALSRDSFRIALDDYEAVLADAQKLGVRYVRFTGGEPMLHREILRLVELGHQYGMKMSMITNGSKLAGASEGLRRAGLDQVIVSIDGSSAASHDLIRRSPGLYQHAISGLVAARECGIKLRVNSVVGPHNYNEMPELRETLQRLHVDQWELSALKLERVIRYDSPADVIASCDALYSVSGSQLRPMGKRFYGETVDEQMRYFSEGIPPRASDPLCHVVEDVLYLDAKNSFIFPCSLLPHREGGPGSARVQLGGSVQLETTELLAARKYFSVQGPKICSGCSATAAGYSDTVELHRKVESWAY